MTIEARYKNLNVKIFSGADICGLESRIIYKDAETLAIYMNPHLSVTRCQQLLDEAIKQGQG